MKLLRVMMISLVVSQWSCGGGSGGDGGSGAITASLPKGSYVVSFTNSDSFTYRFPKAEMTRLSNYVVLDLISRMEGTLDSESGCTFAVNRTEVSLTLEDGGRSGGAVVELQQLEAPCETSLHLTTRAVFTATGTGPGTGFDNLNGSWTLSNEDGFSAHLTVSNDGTLSGDYQTSASASQHTFTGTLAAGMVSGSNNNNNEFAAMLR